MEDPKNDAQLMSLRDEVCAVSVPEVKDDAGKQGASGLLVRLRRVEKEVKARESFFLDPLKKHVKTVQSWFKETYYEPLGIVVKQVAGRIETYENEVAAKKRDELLFKMRGEEKARLKAAEAQVEEKEALAAFGVAPPAPAPLPARTVTPEDVPATLTRAAGGAVFNRETWDFEVVDIIAVPEQYVRREVKRAEVLAALKRGEEIPGIIGKKSIGITVRT